MCVKTGMRRYKLFFEFFELLDSIGLGLRVLQKTVLQRNLPKFNSTRLQERETVPTNRTNQSLNFKRIAHRL